MSGVQTTLALTDRLTGPMMKMMKVTQNMINVMEKMDTAANKVDMKSLTKARSTIQSASADLERLVSSANSAGAGLAPLNRGFANLPGPIGKAASSVGSFFTSFVGAAAAYLSIQSLANGFKSFVTASDEYSSTAARLKLINDETQTQIQLQEKVYQAAQRSRMGYNDMASSVAKLNLLASDSFASNNEALRFTELMGKSFTVGAASTAEKQSAMYQLTQAMAAGKLQGDEFRTISEAAPMLGDAIAKAMGVSKGALKELSSEGAITATIVKSALFGAATDIEAQFKAMPLTFSQAMTQFKNWSLMAFEPLFVRFSQFVNSDAFGVLAGHAMFFVNVFVAGMDLTFDALEYFYNLVSIIGNAFQDNWSWIAPMLVVMGTVLASITAILLTKYAVLGLIKVATLAWAAAQWVVTKAYLANPITWVLIAIIAVLALVVYAVYSWGDATAAVIGAIVGSIAWMGTAFYNTLLFMANLGIASIEWIYNAWNQGAFGIQLAFFTMGQMVGRSMEAVGQAAESIVNQALGGISAVVNGGISGLNKLIGLANNIPGVNISSIGEVDFKVGKSLASTIGSSLQKIAPPTKVPNSLKLGRFDYKDLSQAYTIGNAVGKTISKSATNAMHGLVDKAKGFLGGKGMKDNPFIQDPNALAGLLAPGSTNPLGAGKNPTGGKLDSIGKIDDEINIAEEDIKMMLELADRKSIQNFKTLQPSVTFTGNMNIREEADIDKIVKKISESLTNSMNESVEGAYA